MAAYFDFDFDPISGRIVPKNDPDEIVGVMDGYEDDIEAIYIKGNPIPQWDPLATKNNLAGFSFPGLGALALPDLSKLWEQYWFLILALALLSGAMLIRGRA